MPQVPLSARADPDVYPTPIRCRICPTPHGRRKCDSRCRQTNFGSCKRGATAEGQVSPSAVEAALGTECKVVTPQKRRRGGRPAILEVLGPSSASRRGSLGARGRLALFRSAPRRARQRSPLAARKKRHARCRRRSREAAAAGRDAPSSLSPCDVQTGQSSAGRVVREGSSGSVWVDPQTRHRLLQPRCATDQLRTTTEKSTQPSLTSNRRGSASPTPVPNARSQERSQLCKTLSRVLGGSRRRASLVEVYIGCLVWSPP